MMVPVGKAVFSAVAVLMPGVMGMRMVVHPPYSTSRRRPRRASIVGWLKTHGGEFVDA